MPEVMNPSRLGYDTRSWRSALVMGAVDALNPFKQGAEFRWESPCVVSSIAGLGDLFIHLPLIAGIVAHCRQHQIDLRVALRPAHVEIGRQCGWQVVPFDNALEDFFKNPATLRPADLFARAQSTRDGAPRLWIDLTGNAVSALAVKFAGAAKLAARVTRGGRSLTDYPLPHSIQENEYENRDRLGEYLGCGLDFSVAAKLRGDPLADFAGRVILCVSTASRWKNWPLQNFRTLVERFPKARFLLTGFRREILESETAEMEQLRALPNVFDGLDRFSAAELVRLIAHSSAVVTNDTSAAHIANLFGVSGAVLFGPISPRTFGDPAGLKIFHDATCPFHPCVQWKCRNEAQWCMRKISPEEVGDYLATLPGFTS